MGKVSLLGLMAKIKCSICTRFYFARVEVLGFTKALGYTITGCPKKEVEEICRRGSLVGDLAL